MIFKPNELKLVPLKDVAPGTLVEIANGDARPPLALRIVDRAHATHSSILRLGGEKNSFSDKPWGVRDALARVVCPAESLRFRLGSASKDASMFDAGTLTLREDAAYITSNASGDGDDTMHVSLTEWRRCTLFADNYPRAIYPAWELGMLDHRGDFISIYSHTPVL